MQTPLRPVLLSLAIALAATGASAEVTRVDVTRRADIGSSGYEKIVGTVHFAVDPRQPVNEVIVNLDRAPKNPAGRVEFSADLYILRPKDAARSNGVALVDVVNRGRKTIITGFNRGGTLDPVTEQDLGDGFLMRQGFTLVFVGWQFDVQRRNGLMALDAPRASGADAIVRAVFTPNEREASTTLTDLAGYPPLDPVAADATLTVRDGPFGAPQAIDRSRFTLTGNAVALDTGFEPGRTYEIAYRSGNLPVVGTGLAAFRDVASWIKYHPEAAAPVRQAIAFGSSQSGRFLRTFLYGGFNTDERGRQVLDGVMAHIAGAARLSINEPAASPNSLGMYAATSFPFADRAVRDPISGRTDGLLDNDRARRNQPKIFYTNSSVEYWGGGRAAALVHTTPDGRANLALPDNVRAYLFAGTQHSPGPFPPAATAAQQEPGNPVQYWWALRGLLVAMKAWVVDGAAPPPSQHPQFAEHGAAQTIVRADQLPFPSIPGVQSPRIVLPARQDGQPLPHLVSQVDEDGNEIAGIRLPDVAVPLATYTGWNFRSPAAGATNELVALAGSALVFPRTKAARAASRDPRRSVEERYASRDDYLKRVRAAADQLVAGRYLLAPDVEPIVARAGEMWDLVAAGKGTTQ